MRWIWCWIASASLLAPAAGGQGYSVPDQSAEAAAMGEAYIAGARTASSIYYNPAGLARIDGGEISVGAYGLRFDTSYEGVDGSDEHREFYALPHLYMAAPLSDRVKVGLGVHNSYGLGVDWASDGPLASVADKAALSVFAASPAVAVNVNDRVFVGVAANLYMASFDRVTQSELDPVGPVSVELDGSGAAIGATLGATWLIDDRNAIGVMVRSAFDLNLDGMGEVQSPSGASLIGAPTSLQLRQPWVIGAGYSRSVTERLRVEGNAIWTLWGAQNSVQLESENPLFSSAPPEQFDYGDSLSLRLGAEYELGPRWRLRGGYGYFESVTPDSTFSPLVPDFDAHLVSAGLGLTHGQMRWDFAYQVILRPEREVRASVNSPDGRYEDITHGVMITASVSF